MKIINLSIQQQLVWQSPLRSPLKSLKAPLSNLTEHFADGASQIYRLLTYKVE